MLFTALTALAAPAAAAALVVSSTFSAAPGFPLSKQPLVISSLTTRIAPKTRLYLCDAVDCTACTVYDLNTAAQDTCIATNHKSSSVSVTVEGVPSGGPVPFTVSIHSRCNTGGAIGQAGICFQWPGEALPDDPFITDYTISGRH